MRVGQTSVLLPSTPALPEPLEAFVARPQIVSTTGNGVMWGRPMVAFPAAPLTAMTWMIASTSPRELGCPWMTRNAIVQRTRQAAGATVSRVLAEGAEPSRMQGLAMEEQGLMWPVTLELSMEGLSLT